MPEMQLKQWGFTYGACGSFTKNKERLKKFKERGDTEYIYKNELDKACFEHDVAYGDFKDLARRIATNKFLRHKAFNIAKSPKYDGYQKAIASMVYKMFDKNSAGRGVNMHANNEKLKNYTNQLLKKFKKEQFILDSKKIFGVVI